LTAIFVFIGQQLDKFWCNFTQ